ncbi:Probable zinc metalloprotease EGY1, chloroplastic [Seminavis robusta]|uniref:Probable zinc metalloprotease EGY1, chloroplastic n=1 Tax=Seminavis robusta TaxID=568900 RepID=A0A9N8EJ01_9STRA|nr:Probable zinc metalloprotease EGY1, chloroplastic [Seminavis robusta]|eukprot:Sro1215_g253180.1 Probable zinc metalloprotease EGY1, chloroplastic (831) ;mRNA; f:15449-18131
MTASSVVWMLPVVALLLALSADAFHVPLTPTRTSLAFSSATRPTATKARQTSALYFWGNNNNNNSEDDNNDKKKEDDDKDDKGIFGGLLPFFANNQQEETTDTAEKPVEAPAAEATPVVTTATATPPKPAPGPKKPAVVELDPVEQAKALRAQAERARLEAEKMDAELTLQKISRIEREMASAVAKDETDNVERLQREMDALQAKVRGEPVPTPVAPKLIKLDDSTTSSTTTEKSSSASNEISVTINPQGADLFSGMSIDGNDLEGLIETVENSPSFLKKLFAQMTEIEFVTVSDINSTEVAGRLWQMQNMDFSYSKRPTPTFTQAQIDDAIRNKNFEQLDIVASKLTEETKGNETAKALLALEYEYYIDAYDMGKMEQLLDGEDWLKGVIEAVNKTQVDTSIEAFYPKCTRKEGAALPTDAEMKLLVTDLLPKALFTPRGEPEKVLGGYIVRGTSKFESGDETIAAIDAEMEKTPRLQDKMTILLASDFTVLAEMEDADNFDFRDPEEEPPILFVMGPDIMPDRQRVLLTLTTAFGVATSWYLSIYPFLLNPVLMKRTEEQLQLADASMAYDLSWLSELSLPLFITFMGIQFAHEAGHKLVGAANGASTTFPTFVPSLITGVTSTVTQFKEPPKNKEVMFDVALAGPLAGMLASIAALVLGSQLTLTSDPGLLPALPLDILRQSTLGGGIIDGILGAGALSVPPGAEATDAVAGMTVSLHPVAVAGYIGLILNGLALLPIGTTDGGRIAQALFGRGVKTAIGNLFLFTVFFIGVLGSDLFLFYFSFLIAFQTGNEIPARNEVDNVSFARVLLATASTVLALLALIPFQS